MAEYDNTNTGVLFKNDKGDNPKRPDYTGSINFNGTECWLSAWVKEGKKGKFMSLSVKPKDGAPAQGGQRDTTPEDFDDSSIPF